MTEIGTLKELNVQPGDVLAEAKAQDGETFTVLSDCRLKVTHECGHSQTLNRGWYWDECVFRLISRAAVTPKLWRDMTPEEKGAVLLALYERVDVEVYRKGWEPHFWNAPVYPHLAYRVKPDPKVETVTVPWSVDPQWSEDVYNITFNTIDGKPDCTSVKMEGV